MATLGADMIIRWSKALDEKGNEMEKMRVTALRRSAAYVWRIAKNSIKHVNKTERHVWKDENGREHETTRNIPSPVGKPPYEHGAWWKTSFHFEVDETLGEAYIGPVEGKRHIAPLHEYGGVGVIRWTRYIGNDRVKFQKQHTFPKRPTMQPALDKAKPKLAEFWKNIV